MLIDFRKNKQGGFTLIELLVVVAIISFLSSVVFASLNGARIKARDSKRSEQRYQIEQALNLFYSDNGGYPASNTGPSGPTWLCFGAPSSETCNSGGPYTGSDTFNTAMSPYMKASPVNDAKPGYNRDLYIFVPLPGAFGAGAPAGAYLMWFKEGTMSASECHAAPTSANPLPIWDGTYWLCYEYVGI